MYVDGTHVEQRDPLAGPAPGFDPQQANADDLMEYALEGEITDHLGYDKHDPAGRGTGNSRNGTRAKTVLTDVGPGPR